MNYSPRPDSQFQVAVPATGSSLQISPNLEALLQHDEWSRRGSGSPTSLSQPSPQLSGFAVSLPPPPPRNPARKAVPQEPRAKDTHRKKSTNVSTDSWPDALPLQSAADGSGGHSTPASSRPATPNPYINPTPIVKTINNVADQDASPTSQRSEQARQYEGRASPSLSVPEVCRGLPTPDLQQHVLSSHRSSPALYKVEKILSKGKGSLSLFAGGAIPGSSKIKRDQVRLSHRAHRTDLEDVTVRRSIASTPDLQQVQGLGDKRVSHQLSAFGADTATIASASSRLMSGSRSPRQPSSARPTEDIDPTWPAVSRPSSYSSSSTRSHSLDSPSVSSSSSSDSYHHIPNAIYPTSPSDSDYNIPRLPALERMPSFHQESFMDFFSPSSLDDTDFTHQQQSAPSHASQPNLFLRRPSVASEMETTSLYSTSSANVSSETLASMVFAPPSPTIGSAAGSGELPSPSSAYPGGDSLSLSTSTIALSQMVFAPPSPTGPSNPPSPTYHRRFSSSSSASSLAPLEFAPPSPMSDTGKPPLPTTPKPVFRRRDRRRLDKRSLSASPHPAFTKFANPLPPTTNVLDANERADLIRRNRKLAQVFGQTPGAEMLATDGDEPRLFKILPPPALAAFLGLAKQRNHRHAMSVSVALKTPGHRTEPTSPWQVLDNPWSPGRRHSSPLSPDGFTLYFDSAGAATDQEYTASCSRDPHYHAGPPTSFIDLSDEDILNDGASAISGLSIPKKGGRSRDYRYSTTTPSLAESLSPEAQLEADKRRKREKLAKLHRFLGSRVPTDLVVGALAAPSLPPSPHPDFTTEDASRPIWMQRRRSGSALPTRSEPFDRVKEELGGEEKALNVRRAQKMEKVFGIPPPQTLYHTRPLPSVPVHSQPTSPTGNVSPPFYPSISPVLERNLNQSAYTKTKGKRYERPGTSESTRLLLPNTPNTSVSVDYGSGYQDVLARSTVYMNYHQSLNSLTDIIDRDDKESLAELHRYLHGDVMDSPIDEQPKIDPRRASGSYSIRSERRHSLPTRTSIASFSSELTLPSTKPEATDFQLRRRRAAKLTNFFGVDYRELIDDVLESIEKGVEEERRRGTLQPEEVEVLLHKVQSLRKRDSFS